MAHLNRIINRKSPCFITTSGFKFYRDVKLNQEKFREVVEYLVCVSSATAQFLKTVDKSINNIWPIIKEEASIHYEKLQIMDV